MAIKSEAEIYKIIEMHLKASEAPLSSADLWTRADVQGNARSAEKVSDYLGLMWRRGLLQRWDTPATSVSRSRYAYSWLEPDTSKPTPIVALRPVDNRLQKPKVTITEDDDRVVLDFDKFTITVQSKG